MSIRLRTASTACRAYSCCRSHSFSQFYHFQLPNVARARTCAQASATEDPALQPVETVSLQPFRRPTRINNIKENQTLVGKKVEVKGWVRTIRAQKTFAFLEVNDGSSVTGLQVILNTDATGYNLVDDGLISTGCSVTATGESDATDYPLQKKRHTLEFLRSIAHMRARTNTISAMARVRSALSAATHTFFKQHGFLQVHTPVISASDCEGAGEMFQVTTMLAAAEKGATGDETASVEELQASVAKQGAVVKAAKAKAKDTGDEADKKASKDAIDELLKLKEQLNDAQASAPPSLAPGEIDYAMDFFGKPAYLAVSGQLNGEMYACAMGDIYTFGPTFRAEQSNTSRHLAEFWMVEPEMAFADLADDIDCAEAYLQFCVQYVLDNCKEDLEFFDTRVEKGLIARLTAITERPFVRITYTEAVQLLLDSGEKFEFPVEWGRDLQSEHERWLSEKAFKGTPVAVTDYPKGIKAFYMRLNDDAKTVAAMDVLVPKVGELIGGSQREDRVDVLVARLQEAGLSIEDYKPYLDLRRYGSVPHAGFGLGFERLVQYCTGIDNIRDVIPFPRYPGNADF